eukprot:6189773-Pleurochrysis_carterae.AAC.1
MRKRPNFSHFSSYFASQAGSEFITAANSAQALAKHSELAFSKDSGRGLHAQMHTLSQPRSWRRVAQEASGAIRSSSLTSLVFSPAVTHRPTLPVQLSRDFLTCQIHHASLVIHTLTLWFTSCLASLQRQKCRLRLPDQYGFLSTVLPKRCEVGWGGVEEKS